MCLKMHSRSSHRNYELCVEIIGGMTKLAGGYQRIFLSDSHLLLPLAGIYYKPHVTISKISLLGYLFLYITRDKITPTIIIRAFENQVIKYLIA